MIKNGLFLLLLIVVGLNDAFAVPSVRVLHDNKANVATVKPIASKPKQETNQATIAKSAKPSDTKTNVSRGSFMPSSAKLTNFITGNKVSNSSKPESNKKPDMGDVSQDEFDAVINRIAALEEISENVITDVVETESGAYVTGVSVDGNKLNVNKSHALYAPIRNGSNGDISGTAEIWIVR